MKGIKSYVTVLFSCFAVGGGNHLNVDSGFAVYYFTAQTQRFDVNATATSRDTSLRHSTSNNVTVSIEDSDNFLIPEDNILKVMTRENLILLYEKYTSSQQILCKNMQRVGSIYDGGKEVCVDINIKPKDPCLVYSFGSANRFDFEEQAIKMFKCKVVTFDPSLKGQTLKTPPGCSFYPIGIAGKDTVNGQGWRLKTFTSITDMLTHTGRVIDIVKMDTESSEWGTIPQMIASGSINNIKQLQVEFHFPNGKDVSMMARCLAVFRGLYKAGFRIFNTERNIYCKSCFIPLDGRKVANLVEIAFVNTRFTLNS